MTAEQWDTWEVKKSICSYCGEHYPYEWRREYLCSRCKGKIQKTQKGIHPELSGYALKQAMEGRK